MSQKFSMKTSLKTSVKILSFALIISVALGYAYYQTRDYLKGPVLELYAPENGSTHHIGTVVVEGFAKNISYISVNDKQIFTDQEGNFNEKILLAEGYNVIKISSKDKYQRENQKVLEVVYTPPANSEFQILNFD